MIPRIPVTSSFLGQHSQPVYRPEKNIMALENPGNVKKMIFQYKSPLIGDFQVLCLIILWLSRVIPIFYIVIKRWKSLGSYAIEKHTKYRTGGGLKPGRLRKLRAGAGSKLYGWDRIYPMENGDLRGIWVGLSGDILWCNMM